MKSFLSCDWGTSSFRLRLVEIPGFQFTSVESNDRGIGKTFELWKQKGANNEERFSFYLSVIDQHIKMLEQQLSTSLENIPLIISGMACSSIGMIDLPYKEIPYSTDGSDLIIEKISPTTNFNHDITIISGAKTNSDAMRGEETQLAGCEHLDSEGFFIFPGTHSKHVRIDEGRVTDIKTYMTGEFFDLLSTKSILTASIEKGGGLEDKKNKLSFKAGVNVASQSNLLHTSFTIRTNSLFDKLSNTENYYYLSGLLIGTELIELKKDFDKKITLVINESFGSYYTTALNALGLQEGTSYFLQDADKALVKGQYRIIDKINE